MANRAVREKKKKKGQKSFGEVSLVQIIVLYCPKFPIQVKKAKNIFKKGLKKLNFDSVA